jgi:pyruvate dehydrogenase E2 component (dihydrolipoamide acetyltransferase)
LAQGREIDVMATVVVLPKFGMTMEEGTIVEWYKREGQWVEKGESLLQIETDKVTMDVEAPAAGILRGVQVSVGEVVPVGQSLAYIFAPDEEAEKVESRPAQVSEEAVKAIAADSKKVAVQPESKIEKIVATPAARRLARDTDVDLAKIAPTRPSGRIGKADVEAYLAGLEQTPTPPKGVKAIPLTGMRKTIAERMQTSAREAPHIVLTVEVDMGEVEQLRQRLGKIIATTDGQRISVTAVLTRVVASALQRHPSLNAKLEGEEIWLLPDINLGIAVALEEGLIVPVIHNADQKSLRELSRLLSDLTEKAREGKLIPDDVADGTFTITNLGMYGVDEFEAIINPPQAAILAAGRIVDRAAVVDGEIEIRPTARITLSADHRIVDGAVGANFLREVRQLLENPYLLL